MGSVFLQGELWSARASEGVTITKGTKVLVKEVRGLVLLVERKEP
ncbi:MAG: NfeD family protein [Deltaproteobacteria bacterium]